MMEYKDDKEYIENLKKYIEGLEEEIRRLKGEDREYNFLHLNVRVGDKECSTITKISVPKIGNKYWINRNDEQICVEISDYDFEMGINNIIWCFAEVHDVNYTLRGIIPVKNLFKSKMKAYEYWLENYENKEKRNASWFTIEQMSTEIMKETEKEIKKIQEEKAQLMNENAKLNLELGELQGNMQATKEIIEHQNGLIKQYEDILYSSKNKEVQSNENIK